MASKIRKFEGSDAWLEDQAKSHRLLSDGPRPEGMTDEDWRWESDRLLIDAACYEELLDRRRAMAFVVAVPLDAAELQRRCEEMQRQISAALAVPQGAIDAPELSGSAGAS